MCKQSDVNYLKVKMTDFYKNAICIADKTKLEFQANWWIPTNRIPFITIEPCSAGGAKRSKSGKLC